MRDSLSAGGEQGTTIESVRQELGQLGDDPLARLLNEWLSDESGYDEQIWPAIKQAIEEDRLSNRPRFSD